VKVTQTTWRHDLGREESKQVNVTPGSPLDQVMWPEGVKEVKITKRSGDSVTYVKIEASDELTDEAHDAVVEAHQERIRLGRESQES